MTDRIPFLCVLFFLFVGPASWREANGAENARPLVRLRLHTSLLTTAEVREFLESGITVEQLREKIYSIPLTRIGPGYTLYFLEDGILQVPLGNKPSEKVDRWRLSALDGKTIAEQDGARRPATAVESKSDANENPKPEAEGRFQ